MRIMRVSLDSADRAVRELDSYVRELQDKVHRLIERLAQIGIDTASVSFGRAAYDGDNDVTVSEPQWLDDNRLAITASGKSVLFIEFGSGVYAPGTHPLAGELGMTRGEYGKKRGRNKTWAYYGSQGNTSAGGYEVRNGVILTHGNSPSRSMYYASREMREHVREIAREVFASR